MPTLETALFNRLQPIFESDKTNSEKAREFEKEIIWYLIRL